jgi:hypothetical protein
MSFSDYKVITSIIDYDDNRIPCVSFYEVIPVYSSNEPSYPIAEKYFLGEEKRLIKECGYKKIEESSGLYHTCLGKNFYNGMFQTIARIVIQ